MRSLTIVHIILSESDKIDECGEKTRCDIECTCRKTVFICALCTIIYTYLCPKFTIKWHLFQHSLSNWPDKQSKRYNTDFNFTFLYMSPYDSKIKFLN